jgi:hypothetical protein
MARPSCYQTDFTVFPFAAQNAPGKNIWTAGTRFYRDKDIVSFVQEGLMTNHMFSRRRMMTAGAWEGVFTA